MTGGNPSFSKLGTMSGIARMGPTPESIPASFGPDVREGLPSNIPCPVVEKQSQLPRQKPAGRNRRNVGSEKYPPKLPQGAVCRQWFLPKNVQDRAAKSAP